MADPNLNTLITGAVVFFASFVIQMGAWIIIHRIISASLSKGKLFFISETLRGLSFSITLVFFLVAMYLGITTADRTLLDLGIFRVWAILLIFTLANIVLKLVLTGIDVHYRKKRDKAGIYRSIAIIKSTVGIALYFIAFLMAINVLSAEAGQVISLMGMLLIILLFIAGYDQIKSIIAGIQLGEYYVGEDKIVRVDGKWGVVEEIHGRSTRLRMLDGGTLVIPNKLFFAKMFEISPEEGSSLALELVVKGKSAQKAKERISSISSKVAMSLEELPSEYKPKVFFVGMDEGMLKFSVSFRMKPDPDIRAVVDTFAMELSNEFGGDLYALSLERE